jgi:oligoendopeptidase F
MATTELTGAEEVAWDLSDLFEGPDDPKLEAEVAEAESAGEAFRSRYHGGVSRLEPAELAEAVAERERIESQLDRALAFAHLRFATNMADSARGALLARLQERAAALETKLLFFGLEWAAVENEQADALLADDAVAHWRHYLSSLRKYRPYLLSEPEERVGLVTALRGAPRRPARAPRR